MSADNVPSSGRSNNDRINLSSPDVAMTSLLSGSPPSVIFDVRNDPTTSLIVAIPLLQRYPYFLQQSVSHHSSSAITIVSPDLLWTIKVHTTSDSAVTWDNVFKAIFRALSEPLQDSEWGLANNERRDNMLTSMEQRTSSSHNGRGDRVRRVDWLGRRTLFAGLVKDDDFVTERSLPGQELEGDVWVAKFMERTSA